MTPYEIRLELLRMSKDMLEQDFHSRRELALRKWEQAVDKNETNASNLLTEVPVYPTENQIVSKAKLLNEFISEK
jgi:hypothetical protein